jgi:hypothetical protein
MLVPNSLRSPEALVAGRRFGQFAYLQILDILTTLSFLAVGVQEANPLVRWAMQVLGSPLAGLVAVKTGAIALGLVCLMQGRVKLLGRVNLFFAALVAWNLVCLVVGALGKQA